MTLLHQLDPQWLLAVLLVAVRISALLLVTPVLTMSGVPPMVRFLLVAGFAVALVGGAPDWRSTLPGDFGSVVGAMVSEAMLGATLALGVLASFACFSVAGRLLDVQIGFGIGQVFDPVSLRQAPVLTGLFNQLAIFLFFLAGGHYTLLRGLAYSFRMVTPGAAWQNPDSVTMVIKHAGSMWTLGFALISPVVLCLLLVEFCLGALARNMPQMNMFAFGIPLKIVIGVAALALWLPLMHGPMDRAYALTFSFWEAVLPNG
ncbi:flagellar biosynthetic protein FliR [Pandoraea bronchicola]|uniref:EscT/YscT/HrcT family type III secretion system export apparatus protein n=1 Tax=Pandoraea bronchicola TaxID=2508287 RepID=A0A5E5C038_9BURK|nr:flagellar biosynthetic protein FliR [Pandoraea bronchicola]VVE90682.1 EscT/YscT/HrcT family type III secretion system export apparatus protein [Pandoraea bronchicola]